MEVIEKDGKEYIAISQNGLRNAMYYVKDKHELKGLLDALLESKDSECEPKDVTERIKTFEDACNELGEYNKLVNEYRYVESTNISKDLAAYLKLRIICAALNEGWEPQFTKDEYRYYPYFVLYTEEEVERMDEETKQELGLFGGCARRRRCGFVAADASDAFGYANAYLGSRLCLSTRELAEYCGKQFIALWADFYLIRK